MSRISQFMVAGVIILFCISCKKDFTDAEEDSSGRLSSSQISSAVINGVHHEPFDKLPLELAWLHNEYKPNVNAFAVVKETPAVGAGAAKFILTPDALVAGANKAQLVYRPNHAAGTESVYEYFVRVPASWKDRSGTSDATLTSWNASPDPAVGENWNNMKVNKALAYITYRAEGGKSYFQLVQGLNTTVPFEGKMWTNKIINRVELTKNTWYKLKIRIKWSLGTDGYVMAYMNDQLWASQNSVRTLYNAIPAYFKMGLARSVPANVPENVISILYDDLKISTETNAGITSRIIAQGLTHPWDVVYGADDHIWFTERAGIISRLNPVTGVVTRVLSDFPDEWEAGNTWLLGLALHPQFLSKPYLYTTYSYNRSGVRAQKVVRYTYSGGRLTNPVEIIRNINPGIWEHSGTRLLIAGDYLYVTVGDGGGGSDGKIAQRPNTMSGKVIRVLLNGGIPSNNPIPGSAVYALGFRNSQGLVYAHNKLYATEHGPDNDDEVNIIEPNRNYGWPLVTGYCDQPAESSYCSSLNVKEPLIAWTPTIAPCGIDYYNAGPITQWRNSLLMCTLKNSRLVQLKLNADGSAITETKDFLTNTYGRLRDICISPQGKVYLCTDNGTNDVIVEVTQ